MVGVTKPTTSLRDIPAGVWVLGFVSMLMDVSSEMIHALLPGRVAIGIVLLVAADIALGLLPSIAGVAFGVVLWGLHMGLTQGLLAALIADTSPAELRGTAYGFFNLLGGLAMLAASVIAGALWDAAGPQGTFFAGAGFALAALAGLSAVHGKINEGAGGSHNKVSPNDA
jgi:predicted MFS family arabinose efflux permease